MLASETQAEIKAKAAVECLYWDLWNELMRMHRRIKGQVPIWYG